MEVTDLRKEVWLRRPATFAALRASTATGVTLGRVRLQPCATPFRCQHLLLHSGVVLVR